MHKLLALQKLPEASQSSEQTPLSVQDASGANHKIFRRSILLSYGILEPATNRPLLVHITKSSTAMQKANITCNAGLPFWQYPRLIGNIFSSC
jgi:hypothetical protein